MEDRGRGTLWKGMKKQTRSKQMRGESPEKLPALTGGSEALERGQKLLPSNPPLQGLPNRGPQATCGPRAQFGWPSRSLVEKIDLKKKDKNPDMPRFAPFACHFFKFSGEDPRPPS